MQAAELAALMIAASPGRQEALWGELRGMRAAALFVAGAQEMPELARWLGAWQAWWEAS